jgi:hypothetical protein
VAAGVIVGAATSKPSQQPIPIRVRVRNGIRGIRRK